MITLTSLYRCSFGMKCLYSKICWQGRNAYKSTESDEWLYQILQKPWQSSTSFYRKHKSIFSSENCKLYNYKSLLNIKNISVTSSFTPFPQFSTKITSFKLLGLTGNPFPPETDEYFFSRLQRFSFSCWDMCFERNQYKDLNVEIHSQGLYAHSL